MASVINKTTLLYLESVHTPDYPTTDWIINPDLSALSGVPVKYWKISGDSVVEMNSSEKNTVDANEIAEYKTYRINELTNAMWDYFNTRYPTNTQIGLIISGMDALKHNYLNRQNYLDTANSWQNDVFAYYLIKYTELMGLNTINAISSFTYDFNQFTNDDPEVQVLVANTINN